MLFGNAEKFFFCAVLVLSSWRIRKVRACVPVNAPGPCKFDLETRVPWDNHYVDDRDHINCKPYEDCYLADGESFTVKDGVCRLRDADLPIVVNDVDQPGSQQQLSGHTTFECANGVLAATGGLTQGSVQSIKGCADSCVLTLDQLVNPINYGQCTDNTNGVCVKDRDASAVNVGPSICLGRQIEFITHTGKTVGTSDHFLTAGDTLTVECEASAFNEFHTNKVVFNGVFERRDIIAIRCVQAAGDCPFTFNTRVPWDNMYVNSFDNLKCIGGDQCYIENGDSIGIMDGVCRLRDVDVPIVINGADLPGSEAPLVGTTDIQCSNGVLTASNPNFPDVNGVTAVTGCANSCVLTLDQLASIPAYGTCSGNGAMGSCLEAAGGGAQNMNLDNLCAPGSQIEFIDHTGKTIFTSNVLDGGGAETLSIECQNPQANEFHVNNIVFTDVNGPDHVNGEIVAVRCVQPPGSCPLTFTTGVPWDNMYVNNFDNLHCISGGQCYIENGESIGIMDGVCRLRGVDLPIVINGVDTPGAELELVGLTEVECNNGVLDANNPNWVIGGVSSISGCASACILTLDQLASNPTYGTCSGTPNMGQCLETSPSGPIGQNLDNLCAPGTQIEFIDHTGKTVFTSNALDGGNAETLSIECQNPQANEFHVNSIVFTDANGPDHSNDFIVAVRCVQAADSCPLNFQTQVPWDNNFVDISDLACISNGQCFLENGQSISIQDGVCRLRGADLPIVINGGDVPGSEDELVGTTQVQCANGVLTASNNNWADITPVTDILGCANACIVTVDQLASFPTYGTCSGLPNMGQCLQAMGGGADVQVLDNLCAAGKQIEFIDHTGKTVFTSDVLDGVGETLSIECEAPQANEFHVNRIEFTDANGPSHSNGEIVAVRCVQAAGDCSLTFRTRVPWNNMDVTDWENLRCIRGEDCYIENGDSIFIMDEVCRIRDVDLPIVINGNDEPGSETQLDTTTEIQCVNGVLTAINAGGNFGPIVGVTEITGCASTCVLTLDGLLAAPGYGTCNINGMGMGECLEERGSPTTVTNPLTALCANGDAVEFIDYRGKTLFTSDALDGDETLDIECENVPFNEFHTNRVVFDDPNGLDFGNVDENQGIIAIRCFTP